MAEHFGNPQMVLLLCSNHSLTSFDVLWLDLVPMDDIYKRIAVLDVLVLNQSQTAEPPSFYRRSSSYAPSNIYQLFTYICHKFKIV